MAAVQKRLNQAGLNVAVDGVYGPQTDAAIKRFNATVVKQNVDARRATANIIKTQFTAPRAAPPPPNLDPGLSGPGRLTHAITRMHTEGWSDNAIRVQVKNWHPEWSEARVLNTINAARPVRTTYAPGSAGAAQARLAAHPSIDVAPTTTTEDLRRAHVAARAPIVQMLGGATNPIAQAEWLVSTGGGVIPAYQAGKKFAERPGLRTGAGFGLASGLAAMTLLPVIPGKGVFKAVAEADAPALSSDAATRHAMEALKNHSSRLDVQAQIDAQAETKIAARQIKQKLDNMAIAYADGESKGVPRGQRKAVRQQKAAEFYDQVAASSKGTPEDVRSGFAISNRTKRISNEVGARQGEYDVARKTMKEAEQAHGKKSEEYKLARKDFLQASTELGAAKNAHVFSLLTDRADHLGIDALPADHPLTPARRALAEDLWQRYKGRAGALPPHVKGPKDLERLTSVLADTMKRGEWGRMWYENSAKEILKLSGGDVEKADQIAQLFAIYSPQQPILGNTSLAVRAWNEYLTKGKVEAVGTGPQIAKANSILVDKVPWEGRKTNNFYVNFLEDINSGKYQQLADERAAALAKNKGDLAKTQVGREVTADLWMARAFGYARDAVSHGRYDLIEGITRQLADEEGWKPKQAQAAIWTEIKDFSPYDKSANIDFQTGIRHHMGQFNYEAAIGQMEPELRAAYEKLSPVQQQAMMTDLAAAVDRFAQELGLLHLGSEFGPGVYEGERNLGARLGVATSAAPRVGTKVAYDLTPYEQSLMDATAAAIARGLKQDTVAWYRPITALSKEAAHSMYLRLGRQATNEEAIQLWHALNPGSEERFGVVHGHDGLFIRNFTEEGKPGYVPNFAVGKDAKHFQQLAEDAINSVFPGKPEWIGYSGDGNLVKGTDYEQAVARAFGDAGGSDQGLRFERAAARLASEADAVHQHYLSGDAAAGSQAVVDNVPGLDVPHPNDAASFDEYGNPSPGVRFASGGDTFPAYWADSGTGPGLAAVYDDARNWLADVTWSNMDPEEMHALPDTVVANAINRYYDGGMEQFISDSLYVDPTVPIAEQAAKPIPEVFRLERPIWDNGSTLGDRHLTDEAKLWQGKLLDEYGNPISSARFVTGAQSVSINPAVEAAVRDPYAARELSAGGLTAQFLQPRSRISRYGIKWIDRASVELDRSELVHRLPGIRHVTSSQRVVKAAGRAQRAGTEARLAKMGQAIRTIAKLSEGSAEDVAHFWYAQLPEAYRNAEGLQAVVGLQEGHLRELLDGTIENRLNAEEADLRDAAKQAETKGEVMQLYGEIAKIDRYRKDMPFQVQDVTASLAILKELVANTPELKSEVIDAMRALAEDRKRILIDGGRLDPAKADGREGLLARELGLETDGSEVYVGHRLATPEPLGTYSPASGGTMRVKSPVGAGSRNELVLARNGRLVATTRINYNDWSSSQVFDQANIARDELGKLGPAWNGGSVPADSVLVNAKGETVPKHWRSDELAQFTDDNVEREEIRKKADDVLKGFIAFTPDEQTAMAEKVKELSIAAGEPVGDIRVVKRDLVDRYYAQFRHTATRGGGMKTFDHAIDAVATSIIFARVGYIPKNMVQNLVMAVPHQGAFLLPNTVRAGQVLNDPELKDLIKGQISSSGSTAGLAKELTAKKVERTITHYVTSIADDPARISAFLHEAAAAGVIPRTGFLLGPEHRAALIDLLRNPRKEKQLFDITRRAVESMGDFARMTPSQARFARRLLIIPGWLVAGSRYPFHFALTHPVRSALIAYALMGEPGAPKELQFNQPITHYLHGSKYLIGFDTRWGRLRIASLDPISTPIDLAKEAYGSVRGKKSPFDFNTPTAFDSAAPLVAVGTKIAQGDAGNLLSFSGVEKTFVKPLVPDYSLIKDLVTGVASSPHYPDDNTWWRRLEREVGVAPIRVVDNPPRKAKARKPSSGGSIFGGGGGGSDVFSGGSSKKSVFGG